MNKKIIQLFLITFISSFVLISCDSSKQTKCENLYNAINRVTQINKNNDVNTKDQINEFGNVLKSNLTIPDIEKLYPINQSILVNTESAYEMSDMALQTFVITLELKDESLTKLKDEFINIQNERKNIVNLYKEDIARINDQSSIEQNRSVLVNYSKKYLETLELENKILEDINNSCSE